MSLPPFRDRLDQSGLEETIRHRDRRRAAEGAKYILSITLKDHPLPDSLEHWRARVIGESKEFVSNGWQLGAMEDYVDASLRRANSHRRQLLLWTKPVLRQSFQKVLEGSSKL